MFFIASMPRTRTYWLAQYFNGIPGVVCHHELLNGMTSRQQFYDIMEENEGIVGDSDCGLFITDFQKRWPQAPTVIVERQFDDVCASLAKVMRAQGLEIVPVEIMQKIQENVNKLHGLRVAFEDLDDKLPEIHRVLGIPFNKEYAEKMSGMNLQLTTVSGNTDSVMIWR
jgi:hypothetical protein